jgi:hypothetical protein
MSSTPESGDIHDASHVVPFLGASVPRQPLSFEELEIAALHDPGLQLALTAVVNRAQELFGVGPQITFTADPDIEGRTYYVVEISVHMPYDEARSLERTWMRVLRDVKDQAHRLTLSLTFAE